MNHFIHSGDLGDVIYALPTVKALGGGVMHLLHDPFLTMHGMTPDRFQAIAPLLTAQPYISGVTPEGPLTPDGYRLHARHLGLGNGFYNLNEFRASNRNLRTEWLPNHYLDIHGVSREAAKEAWLTVEPPMTACPVLIARSPRYQNPRFPWKRVMERYGDYAKFVGTAAEHAAFCVAFGDLPRLYTKNLLELARYTSACLLFIGNQSCPLAIAEGLKKPIVQETCLDCPNCISPRPDFVAGWNHDVELPDLEELCQSTGFKAPLNTPALCTKN